MYSIPMDLIIPRTFPERPPELYIIPDSGDLWFASVIVRQSHLPHSQCDQRKWKSRLLPHQQPLFGSKGTALVTT